MAMYCRYLPFFEDLSALLALLDVPVALMFRFSP